MKPRPEGNIVPEPHRSLTYLKVFITSLSAALSLIVVAIFVFLYGRVDSQLSQRMREQAVAYHDLVMHARNWNYDYGGVYVLKRPGVEANSYLRRVGIDPDATVGGETFTIRNHAMMITEISRMSERHEGVRFRITSLRSINPDNAPDRLETEALERFEHLEEPVSRVEHPAGKPPVYRYLTPLKADRTCLECHRTQGYRFGSIVGAVSITIPIEAMIHEAKTSKILLVIAGLLVLILLIGVSYVLTWRLVRKLDSVQRRYVSLIATDELTRVRNRRSMLRRLDEECERSDRLGAPLSILLIDIDHFKKINDTFGHPFGDLVLRRVASQMKAGLRGYDILGRIGGEEFMIISPGVPLEDAVLLAERIRAQVEEMKVVDGNRECPVTISIGLATFSRGVTTPDLLMRRADEALYRAKGEGRNRVVAG